MTNNDDTQKARHDQCLGQHFPSWEQTTLLQPLRKKDLPEETQDSSVTSAQWPVCFETIHFSLPNLENRCGLCRRGMQVLNACTRELLYHITRAPRRNSFLLAFGNMPTSILNGIRVTTLSVARTRNHFGKQFLKNTYVRILNVNGLTTLFCLCYVQIILSRLYCG